MSPASTMKIKIISIIGIFLLLLNFVNAFNLRSVSGTVFCDNIDDNTIILRDVKCGCATNQNPFMKIDALSSNAHAGTLQSSYSYPVCSLTQTCSIQQATCSADNPCVGSISAETNAHLKKECTYPYKICCGEKITPPPSILTGCSSKSQTDCINSCYFDITCKDCPISLIADDCSSYDGTNCIDENFCSGIRTQFCEWKDNACSIKSQVPAVLAQDCTQTSCIEPYICDESEKICVWPNCKSKGGIVCQSDQQCPNGPLIDANGQSLTTSDAPLCCAPNNGVLSCISTYTDLQGYTKIISASECTNPDANGIGKRTITVDGTTSEESCAVLTIKKPVPLFTNFNIILSLILITGFYFIKRKL